MRNCHAGVNSEYGRVDNLDIIRVQDRDNLIMDKLADEQVAERNVPDGA